VKTISISDARNHLPSVIDEVMKTHEQIVVIRHGTPMVAIMPFRDMNPEANRYPLRGHPLAVAADFNDPMPDLWDALIVKDGTGGYRVGPGSRSRRRSRATSENIPVGKPEGRKRKG